MTAIVLILPVISRYSFGDPDWREQYEREREAAMMNDLQPPPRTRPICVTRQLSDCQRREGNSDV
jgi:hypothetical protein